MLFLHGFYNIKMTCESIEIDNLFFTFISIQKVTPNTITNACYFMNS